VIVGANWKSGTDITALDNIKSRKADVKVDTEFKFRFNNRGMLSTQEIKGVADESQISSIEILADHGFVYVASKEFFCYSKKESVIFDGEITQDVPEYVKVSLGSFYRSGISEEVYSVFRTSGIPTFMTPMVITRFVTSDYEKPVIVKDTKDLDSIDRTDVLTMEKRFTGIEEPIVEIYEVDTIKELHNNSNNIISPSEYIYNPFDGKVYVRGVVHRALLEYEVSTTKEFLLGSKFAPSRTGLQKGILALVPDIVVKQKQGLSSINRRLLDRKGSNIFINQPESSSILIIPKTVYTNKEKVELNYITLQNNFEYAFCRFPDNPNTEIYLSSVRVGKTDSQGDVLLPILGYLEDGIHTSMVVKGPKKVNVNASPSGIVSGILKVFMYSSVSGELVSVEDFVINKQKINVAIGEFQRITKYIPIGITSFDLKEIINIDNLRVSKLRDSYNFGDPVAISSLSLSKYDNFGINVEVPPQPEALVVQYDTLPFRAIDPEGGGNYGI
jgi:hypothetical protein